MQPRGVAYDVLVLDGLYCLLILRRVGLCWIWMCVGASAFSVSIQYA